MGAFTPAEVIEAWRLGESLGHVSKKSSGRSLMAFGAACLEATPMGRVRGAVMYERYLHWCRSIGGVVSVCPPRLFTLEMTRFGLPRDLSYPTQWLGVELLDSPRELAPHMLDGVRYVDAKEASIRVAAVTAALKRQRQEQAEREKAVEKAKGHAAHKRNSEMDGDVFAWAFTQLVAERGNLLDMRLAHARYVLNCREDDQPYYGIAEFVAAMKTQTDYMIQGKGSTAHCLGHRLVERED